MLFLFTVITATLFAQAQSDIPYVSTSQAVIDAMLDAAKVGPGDVLVDLGSGDGRIPISAAQRFGIRASGVEINPDLVKQAQLTAEASGVADKVTFSSGDLFSYDLSKTTVVTAFLLPSVNLRLRAKLLAELPVGARVVTHKFDMGSWKPDLVTQAGNETIYLWTIPKNRQIAAAPVAVPQPKPIDELRALFAYQAPPADTQLTPLPSPAGVVVERIVYQGKEGRVSGALVRPARSGRHPAVLFLHDAGRKHDQFLGEAIVLAQGASPLVSLLPDAPASRPAGWRKNFNPMLDNNDRNICIQAIVDTRIGLDLLAAREDVDAGRMAIIGHGYGAMWAGILAGVEARLKGAVLLSPMASIADGLASDDPDSSDLRYAIGPVVFAKYIQSLRDFDLSPYLKAARGPVLVQYGQYDPFLEYRYAGRLRAEGRTLTTYDAGQDVNTPQAIAHRHALLQKLFAAGK